MYQMKTRKKEKIAEQHTKLTWKEIKRQRVLLFGLSCSSYMVLSFVICRLAAG